MRVLDADVDFYCALVDAQYEERHWAIPNDIFWNMYLMGGEL